MTTTNETLAEPKFGVGDRVFSHYAMSWGTILRVAHTEPSAAHGVTGDPLPSSTWYDVAMDKGGVELLDDAGGDWNLARVLSPEVAERFGWGRDPREGSFAWADGFGVWHARVSKTCASPIITARGLLRDELLSRDENTAPCTWMAPVRAPELDDETTFVYREADLADDADNTNVKEN